MATRLRGGEPVPRQWATVAVADTGPGIPPEKQHLLFQEFMRLEPANTPGAGLGLAISQRTAEALGGRITVESALGRGSTFVLWLPVHEAGARGSNRASAPAGSSA